MCQAPPLCSQKGSKAYGKRGVFIEVATKLRPKAKLGSLDQPALPPMGHYLSLPFVWRWVTCRISCSQQPFKPSASVASQPEYQSWLLFSELAPFYGQAMAQNGREEEECEEEVKVLTQCGSISHAPSPEDSSPMPEKKG